MRRHCTPVSAAASAANPVPNRERRRKKEREKSRCGYQIEFNLISQKAKVSVKLKNSSSHGGKKDDF
jgi:hypothetical protein